MESAARLYNLRRRGGAAVTRHPGTPPASSSEAGGVCVWEGGLSGQATCDLDPRNTGGAGEGGARPWCCDTPPTSRLDSRPTQQTGR